MNTSDPTGAHVASVRSRNGPRQPDQAPWAAAYVLALAFLVALLLAKRRVLA